MKIGKSRGATIKCCFVYKVFAAKRHLHQQLIFTQSTDTLKHKK